VKREYKIEIERDGRWWMVRIPELDGLTQARRLAEASLMGREWIAVSIGTPIDDITVHITSITVPGAGDIQAGAASIHDLREAARRAESTAAEEMRHYVQVVNQADIPVRDVAFLLDVSPQRISQIAAGTR
jgi:hypothetical protein